MTGKEKFMFKTRMTQMFGIEHPIMMAGMNWITEPKLVPPSAMPEVWEFWPLRAAPRRKRGKISGRSGR